MVAHEQSFLKGRSEPQHLDQSGERVSDLGEISNAPTQRRRLAVHEDIETLPFRKDFDEIGDFRDGVVGWEVPLQQNPRNQSLGRWKRGWKIYEQIVF
jgi:hypothetical protein